MKFLPAPPVKKFPVTRFFPFGRGDRGSRQRVVVELKQINGGMKLKTLSVKVLRTHEPTLTVAMVGVSQTNGKRRVFFTSQFFEAFNTAKAAVRQFKTVRHNNKVIQRKRANAKV